MGMELGSSEAPAMGTTDAAKAQADQSPSLGPVRAPRHRARLCHDRSSPTLLADLHNAAQEPLGRNVVDKAEPVGSPCVRGAGAAAGVIHRGAFACRFQEQDVRAHYEWAPADELAGPRRRVFRAQGRLQARRAVAVRRLPRSNADDIDQAWSEIGILSELDHPSILRVHEAFEDVESAYVVTELCLGGCLADWLPRMQGNASFAARVTREITGALAHCHARSVCHRDLKPESVLLVFDDPSSPVRVADFGLAKRCSRRVHMRRLTWAQAGAANRRHSGKGGHGQTPAPQQSVQPGLSRMNSLIGTPEYMAPEVVSILRQQLMGEVADAQPASYDFRCDVWSLGVVAYMLLTGAPPYSVEDISSFAFSGSQLPELPRKPAPGATPPPPLPDGALDFLRECLRPDFTARPTAAKLLSLPWLTPQASTGSVPLSPRVAADLAVRIRRFMTLSPLTRAARTSAARHVGTLEHERLRGAFLSLGPDSSGAVPVEDLARALGLGAGPLLELDTDASGAVDFAEFVAAVVDDSLEEWPELLAAAFRSFDLDGDGSITRSELARVLEDAPAVEALCAGDADGDGALCFSEFVELLQRA